MRHNRQWSVRKGADGSLVMRVKQWRAFEQSATSLGTRSVFGVIEEYHEDDKIMCDFDDLEVKRAHKNRHRRYRRATGNPKRLNRYVPSPPVQSLAHTLGLKVVWQRWDKTQHGWHLVIKIRQRLTLAEIIAAQAILGSDRARERLNLARAISIRLRPSKFWKARANILYKRKIK